MQKLKLLKKDFVSQDTKSILGCLLPSGKAYYMKDDKGKIFYGSDDYAKKNFNDERKNVMDFTKSLIVNFKHNTNGSRQSSNSRKRVLLNEDEVNMNNALLYLHLSVEKMKNFTGYRKNEFLSSVYSYYIKNEFLSEKQVVAVLKKEKDQCANFKNKHNCHIFSLKNLQTCYAYEYKLKRAIGYLSDEKKEYLQSMLLTLYKYLYLTDKQVEGIKKWFKFLSKDLQETELKPFDVER